MPSSPNPPAASHLASAATSGRGVFAVLLPITFAVFVGFLAIGMVLPVLPLHINGTLGMSTLVVGIAAGAQFAAALLSRAWAGGMADTRGSKTAVVSGLLVAAAAGLAYLLSAGFNHTPELAVGIILVGRVLQGCAESLIVTGALSWGVGLVGPQNAGKVMAWVGIAIYGAYAAGAPLGVHLHDGEGFSAVAGGSVVLPALAWVFIASVKPIAPSGVQRMPFYKVLGQVWVPGLGLALSSAGFGLLTAFIPLLFAGKSWGSPSLAFTAFGVAFIGARLLFGHLPDKVGGAKVALVCVLIEACGQAMIWLAPTPAVAFAGAALTGFGYSLAFPGFGVESVKRAPPQNRGAAMGAYVAFLDIALGLINPCAGALAQAWGVEAVFLFGTWVVAGGTLVALRLWTAPVVGGWAAMSWLNELASCLPSLIVPSKNLGGRERHDALVMDTRLVSAHIRRLSLGGPGIQRFIMERGVGQPAAWVKLFVAAPGGFTIGRAYTIRRVDRALGRIEVDFVRHEHGPVSQWADRARVGDAVSLAGPRPGGFVLREDTRWLVLVADASVLPAIETILSSLPEPLEVTALVELPSAQDGRVMTSASMVRLHWVLAGERPGPVETVQSWAVPEEVASCQVWLAGEAGMVTALRQHVLGAWRLPRERLYGKAYWRRGQADFRSRDEGDVEGFQT